MNTHKHTHANAWSTRERRLLMFAGGPETSSTPEPTQEADPSTTPESNESGENPEAAAEARIGSTEEKIGTEQARMDRAVSMLQDIKAQAVDMQADISELEATLKKNGVELPEEDSSEQTESAEEGATEEEDAPEGDTAADEGAEATPEASTDNSSEASTSDGADTPETPDAASTESKADAPSSSELQSAAAAAVPEGPARQMMYNIEPESLPPAIQQIITASQENRSVDFTYDGSNPDMRTLTIQDSPQNKQAESAEKQSNNPDVRAAMRMIENGVKLIETGNKSNEQLLMVMGLIMIAVGLFKLMQAKKKEREQEKKQQQQGQERPRATVIAPSGPQTSYLIRVENPSNHSTIDVIVDRPPSSESEPWTDADQNKADATAESIAATMQQLPDAIRIAAEKGMNVSFHANAQSGDISLVVEGPNIGQKFGGEQYLQAKGENAVVIDASTASEQGNEDAASEASSTESTAPTGSAPTGGGFGGAGA